MSAPVGRAELRALLDPRSVAVLGASANAGKAGAALLRSMAGFSGELIAVNARASEPIAGLPTVRSLGELERPVDLAILAIPASACPAAIAEAAGCGVGAAIVCAGGMSEAGPQGVELERQLGEAARAGERPLRLLGPNTSGVIRPAGGFCASFVTATREIATGGVGIIARSGGVNHALAFALDARGVGISVAAGVGNGLDVDEAELLRYLADHEGTTAIALHVEGIRDGRALFEAVSYASSRKPVVAIKVGRTDVDRLARSHTGAMTGSYELARAALAQAGAVVVEGSDEMLDALAALCRSRLPAGSDAGVGLISGQAGPALLLADELQARGGRLPELEPDTNVMLSSLLGGDTFTGNPVDTGRPEIGSFTGAAVALAADPAVDLLVGYALDEPEALDLPAAAERISNATEVPLIIASGGRQPRMRDLGDRLAEIGIPLLDSPEGAARAAAALLEDSAARALAGTPDACLDGTAPSIQPKPIDEDEAKALLSAAGIRRPPSAVCTDHAAAREALRELGGPVVAKRLDPALEHKSGLGAVKLGLRTEEQLDAALGELDQVDLPGPRRYLIEREAEAGVDLIVGGSRHPDWGPTVLVGIGGTAAEAINDTAVSLAPLSPAQAEALIARLGAQRLLDGFRDLPPVDRTALAEVIVLCGELLLANPQLSELDLNPVRATADGLVCLDALIAS